MKRVKPLIKEFHDYRKRLVIYNHEAIQKAKLTLDNKYQNSPEHKRYSLIMTRVETGIKNQMLSFISLENIFEQLKMMILTLW